MDDIYASEGLEKAFPKDLLTMLKAYGGHYWGVPVNIHRSNVLWYSKAVFDANGLKPPTTFDEFKTVAEALKAKGIVPFVMGTKEGWEAGHVFEGVLAGTLGAEKYKGLWTGATPWTDPLVTKALENFKMMLTYENSRPLGPHLGRRRPVPHRRQGRHDDHGRLDRWLVHLQGIHRLRLGTASRHPGHLRRPV